MTFDEAKLPDLKIYVSESSKQPDEHNSYMNFTNPSSRIMIKRKEAINQASQAMEAEMKKKDQKGTKRRQGITNEEVFNDKFLYLSLYSMKGCTITLACSFPNQPDTQGQMVKGKPGGTEKISMGQKKDILQKFKSEVEEKVIEIENNLGGQKEYFEYLSSIRVRREQAGLRNCDTNFIDRNID